MEILIKEASDLTCSQAGIRMGKDRLASSLPGQDTGRCFVLGRAGKLLENLLIKDN